MHSLVSVSNLALADNQYRAYTQIDQTGSLILHGAFVGLALMF